MKLIEFTRPKIDFEKMKEIKKEFKKRGIPFVDRHTHSITKYTESLDLSKSPPIEGPWLEIVDFAYKLGFDEFAITDQSCKLFSYLKRIKDIQLKNNYGKNTFDKYVEYLDKVKQNYPNLKFFGGIELKLTKMKDLEFIDQNKLSKLDFILLHIESKKSDFKGIRKKFGKRINLIFAHPNLRYIFGDNYNRKKISELIADMKENNLVFEINRKLLDQILLDESLYNEFFGMAIQKKLLFSLGSDYRAIPGRYDLFFGKTLEVIKKYNLTGNNFLRM